MLALCCMEYDDMKYLLIGDLQELQHHAVSPHVPQ